MESEMFIKPNKEPVLNELKELTEEKKSKQINLKVLLDILELKHYETSFMQCDCESEISFFVTVPKEDVILIPGLKEFQDFFTKLITNLYKKKKINNHFELNDYLNFNLNLLFNYSPFAIKDDDEILWNIHKNYIEVGFNYNDPENNELDCEFDRLIDSISEEYKKEITVKFDSYSSADYFLEGNEDYEQRELFEKVINKLFFYEYKMTIYEYLQETTYRIDIEDVDIKIKNHLQRIHRQVLFEAYEKMILNINK